MWRVPTSIVGYVRWPLMFWPAFKEFKPHVYLATIHGRSTAPPRPLWERKSRVVSTGTYPHTSLSASPSPFHLAYEYPSGLTIPHLCLPLHLRLPVQEVSSTVSLQVGGLDSWNVTAAEAIGDFPEVTGTAIFSPTLTASGSGSSSTSTSHSSSNHSGIEGGVIGGILGATLISGVVTWFVIRRRRARWASSTADTKGEIEQSTTDPLTIETPRLYDPLDPTTYPRTEFQPQRFGSTSHLQPIQLGYSGLHEV